MVRRSRFFQIDGVAVMRPVAGNSYLKLWCQFSSAIKPDVQNEWMPFCVIFPACLVAWSTTRLLYRTVKVCIERFYCPCWDTFFVRPKNKKHASMTLSSKFKVDVEDGSGDQSAKEHGSRYQGNQSSCCSSSANVRRSRQPPT
jgi:hypothetical protein